MIGELAGHYRVLESLGVGGMGEVYLAEDVRLHRQVALKMLPRACATEAAAGRLLREAQVASALNHPNIAVIYDVAELERDGSRQLFMAMEYVAGQTLSAYVKARDLEVGEILELVIQVANALTEAHGRGIVHRDIKPSNVMVTENGRVKVLDFGLALYQPLADESANTWSAYRPELAAGEGGLAGTIAYMSPEQVRGRDVDARSDVFSLGVVLYELLSGRLPFSGANSIETLDAILREDPPPLLRKGESAGPGLECLVRRLLAKDPDRRYQSMRDVGLDLEELRRHPEARGVAPPDESRPDARTIAVMSFANITGSGEDDWLGTGIAETLTADLKAVEGLSVISRERIYEVLRKLSGPDSGGEDALATHLGREVGARLVVGGGYQRLGDVVRVTARITDVDSGTVSLTVKIDGRVDRIFELQDRIVGELAAGLRPSPAARSAAEEPEGTKVIAAYEAFAKGLINLRAETLESLDRAALFFERAVALDPGYARAHLQLGSALAVKSSYLAMPELLGRAIACLRRALELAPTLAEAWRELGAALVYLDREDEAIEAIERALALDPTDASAHSALARVFFIGKAQFERAAALYERALALNPQAGWGALQMAHCLTLLRDFPRAEAMARRAALLQEELLSGQQGMLIVGAYMRLGHLAAVQNRPAEAREHLEREMRFVSRVDHALKQRIAIELQMRLGGALLRLGEAAAGRAALDEALAAFERRLRLGTDEPFTRYYAACAYALRGDREAAVECLARTIAMRRAFTVVRARMDPDLDGLRDLPRFQELVGA